MTAMKDSYGYDVLSVGIIGAIVVLLIARWDIYPVFVDIYYHASVVVSFEKAGGISLWDFWEFAPLGRPHLYPPLLHGLMMLFSEGLGIATVSRITSFVMFPASLVTMWWVSRGIYSSRTAFYSVLVLSSCYEYFNLQSVTSAAGLVLVAAPLLFYWFEKGKYIAAVVVLAGCLYTHISLGPIVLCALVLYGVLCKKALLGVKVAAGSLLLYSPWLLHIVVNVSSLSASSPSSNAFIALFPWLLGISGVILCVKKKGEFLIPVSILVCMVPIAIAYPGRFTGHALLPLSMLSGIFLSHIEKRLSPRKRYAVIVTSLLVLGLIAPTVGIREGRGVNRGPGITGNEPGTANGGNQPSLPPQKEVRPQLDQRSHSRFTLRIPSLFLIILKAPSETYLNPENLAMARIIVKNSQENEIVFIPSGIMGCFVTATTGRPQTLGMWQEVASDYEPDPKSASIFVFPKDRRAPSQLIKIGETEQWGLYRAPEKKTVVVPEAAISTTLVYSILLLAAGAVVYDLLRKPRQKRR
ncbi:MAG: hypothetical protein HXS40_02720 [Theionarchaea archaeon]|nr:hypothetical protein [Theionarchaea archaeon]